MNLKSVLPSSIIWNSQTRIGISSSLQVCWKSPVNLSCTRILFAGSLLNYKFIFTTSDWSIHIVCFILIWSWHVVCFQKFVSFFKDVHFVGIEFFYDFFFFFGISVLLVVISPLSFLILFIQVFSLFFWTSLAKSLSSLSFEKKKKKLLLSLIFDLCFISCVIFIVSFLLLTFYFIFLNTFRWKVRLFILIFSCFLRNACITRNIPLRNAFASSHGFLENCVSFPFEEAVISFSFTNCCRESPSQSS